MIAAAGTGFHFATITVGNRRGFFAAVVAATFGDVDFAANDGLDVPFASFVEKIGGGEEIAVIGDGHSGHLLARGFVEKLGSFARTVEKTEVSMNVKMNKLGIAHGN